MDVTTEISTFGDSLIAPRLQRPRYAMVAQGPVTGLIHADGWSAFTESGSIQHNDGHGSQADATMLLDLKWRMQAADRALRTNRWVEAGGTAP